MAWIVWRGRGARKVATIRWNDPKTGVEQAKALGTDDPHVARLEKARIEAEVERRAPRLAQLTGDDLLDAWITDRKARGHVGESTEDYYRGKVGPFLRAHPDLPVARLTARHVEVWVAAHPKWKPRSVQAFLVSLGTMLAWAKKAGQLVPAGLVEEVRAIERPPIRMIDRNVLTPAQVTSLLTAARGTDLEPAVALAAGAGLGLGDLRRLTWGEVDLRGGWIRAQRSKTGRDLLVPIGPRLRAVLKAVPPGKAAETVCHLPASDSSAYKGWARLCAAAGVPSRGGWKRLRHTYATLLDAAGVDSATRRDLMAHAPGSRMTDLYTHTDRGRLKAGIAAVERAVKH